ncbi:unnamed protein product, partial [Mesorhabditis belari]|uniref:PRA1 family protein n=1 Tax=Mesorhabditis belari TaxID=2138241 RepID=A0AAF3EAY6_9BILA
MASQRSSRVDQPSVSGSEAGSFTLFNGAELPPFRAINDFLLESARYERPPLEDLARWNNRIISNLLYYQTNYFMVFILLLGGFTIAYGQDFAVGLCAISLVTGSAVFSISPNPRFHELRREHPLITLGSIVVSFYLFITFLWSVAIVFVGVLIPLLICMIHASCRLRNLKNKATEFMERAGVRKTVMGQILDACGVTVKA